MKFFNGFFIIMDKAGDDKGGGGGAAAPTKEEFDALKKQNETLMAKFAEFEKKSSKKPKDDDDSDDDEGDDDDLQKKAAKTKADKEARELESKQLESAIRFNHGLAEWVKTNKSLLPNSIENLVAQGEKETYDSAIKKDQDIKSGIISEFFAIQANVELLTPGLKSTLEDFKKLTKDDKQKRAQEVYANVFEPAFEMLKRVKKAEQINGQKESTTGEKAYIDRMMKNSRKHYLGEKAQ